MTFTVSEREWLGQPSQILRCFQKWRKTKKNGHKARTNTKTKASPPRDVQNLPTPTWISWDVSCLVQTIENDSEKGTIIILLWILCNRQKRQHMFRHEICQKFYTTGFLGQKLYTLKVRKLRLFLLTKKQRKFIIISNLSNFLVRVQLSV